METMTDYEKQGIDFLMKHNIQMTVKYLEHKKFFDDDKESRDVYRIRIFRKGGKGFSFRFGQSIAESTGFGSHPPRAYDVLTCLQKYDPESFENFCSEFGYDTDSRRAEKTYKAVCKEWQNVSTFFTPEELEELSEIQ